MFAKQLRWWKSVGEKSNDQRGGPDASGRYLIEFDMMLKGSVYKRPYGSVRQFGVTVDGKTCLVTSGDHVDRMTYEALLDAGALREDVYGVRHAHESKPTPPSEGESRTAIAE